MGTPVPQAIPLNLQGMNPPSWFFNIRYSSTRVIQPDNILARAPPSESPKIKVFCFRGWSSAASLLKHATGWVGDDLEERLQEVYEARSVWEP